MESRPDHKKVLGAVRHILKENYIAKPPVDVIEIARNYGLQSRRIDFTAKGRADIAGYLDIEKKTIFVNESNPVKRQLFTVAHELGHWILHRNELVSQPEKYAIMYHEPLGRQNNDPIEVEANLFAAHLLVPDHLLSQFEDLNLSDATKIFGVQQEVITFRQNPNYAL